MPSRKPRPGGSAPPAVDDSALLRAEIVSLGRDIQMLADGIRELQDQRVAEVAGIPVTASVLTPAPGDIVVFSVREDLPPEKFAPLQAALKKLMAQFGVTRWILLTGGMTVQEMTREQIERLLGAAK